MNYKLILITLFLSISAANIIAKKSDRDMPIIIRGNIEGDPINGNYKLSGNIEVTQGTLLIHASELDYVQISNKYYIMNLQGSPARFQQLLDNKNKQGKNKLLKGSANHLSYNSQTGQISMQGGAHLDVDGDKLSGNKAEYNTISEKYKVIGSKKNRATLIIYPKK